MNRTTLGRVAAAVASVLVVSAVLGAAKPAANSSEPKPLPPVGKPLAAAEHSELQAGVDRLAKEIEQLKTKYANDPKHLALVADVEIYLNAVRYPLKYHEPIDAAKAKAALLTGTDRAKSLAEGKAPWVLAGGGRGYWSKIDGSAQPYILSVPKGFDPKAGKKLRVDIFCHGRGEDLMELKFLGGKPAEVTDRLLVHPYGRYCCANKFAGEIDTMEILDSLRSQYPIDEQRIVMTGFSMGGAAAWHLSVHYADLWCAASPGAGFCETKIYQKLAEKGELETTPWWEQKLWHLYDCPDYALNLSMCPTIAYAGEIDPQQQSGDIMEKTMKELGLKLDRIYGPKTAHKYEKNAKIELDKRLDAYAAKGRNDVPTVVNFETRTLKYNHMFWVRVDGLDRHWEQTKVTATITDPKGLISAKTENVSAVTLQFAAGLAPFPVGTSPKVKLDGTELTGPAVEADKSWTAHFVKSGAQWKVGILAAGELRKTNGLQGPIDDAFMDRFVFVTPSGKWGSNKVAEWYQAEQERAAQRWHGIFRGEVKTVRDTQLSDADIASSNLILWGDPSSNAVLARIADRLPIKWTGKTITAGDKTYDAAHHAVILIYPNPLNPKKYVVLNSGFTFREDSNGTNSRQVAKLPDYAVIDVNTPPSASHPGGIVDAGFFDEKWQLQPGEGK